MQIEIEASTTIWTDIVVRKTNGEAVFMGALEMVGGRYELKRGHGSMKLIKTFHGGRHQLAVLGDALKYIATLEVVAV